MNKEVWKDISGYEHIYQASNMGRIKSLDRPTVTGKIRKGKMMKLTKQRGKYVVTLSKNNQQGNGNVGRIIYITFKGAIHGSEKIRFKDDNHDNLKLSNLYSQTLEDFAHEPKNLEIKNKAGFRGVFHRNHVEASFTVNNKKTHIGLYKTFEEAKKALKDYLKDKNIDRDGSIYQHNKYVSQCRINGKSIIIGIYDNPIVAAKAYDKYVMEKIGEKAITNKFLGLLKGVI